MPTATDTSTTDSHARRPAPAGSTRSRGTGSVTPDTVDPDRLNVIAYCRVSTEEQGRSGLGMDAQEAAIRAHAERMGWNVMRVVREEASGKDMREAARPLLRAALRDLDDKSHPAGALVVAKLDRLSRSVIDGAKTFERARAAGWALVAIDLQIDTSTPTGELMANVVLTVAQWERRMIGQRTRDALAMKRAQGVKLGRVLTPAQKRQRTRAKDRIRALRAQGMSIRAIVDELNGAGFKTITGKGVWTRKVVHSLVREIDHEAGAPAAKA